jgi:hypothetical protein
MILNRSLQTVFCEGQPGRHRTFFAICALLLGAMAACGGDASEADKLGVGAQCTKDDDCTETGQSCLTEFKGGYCGISGCTSNQDCPEASLCVTHDNGTNYCFRSCLEKAECNRNRSGENESNCSSSITFVDEATKGKACVPPSSGTDSTDADAGSKNKGK